MCDAGGVKRVDRVVRDYSQRTSETYLEAGDGPSRVARLEVRTRFGGGRVWTEADAETETKGRGRGRGRGRREKREREGEKQIVGSSITRSWRRMAGFAGVERQRAESRGARRASSKRRGGRHKRRRRRSEARRHRRRRRRRSLARLVDSQRAWYSARVQLPIAQQQRKGNLASARAGGSCLCC